MSTLRYGVLAVGGPRQKERYVIVDTRTNGLVEGAYTSLSVALDCAAFRILSGEPLQDRRSPAKALGLRFPSGADLAETWRRYFADAEEGV